MTAVVVSHQTGRAIPLGPIPMQEHRAREAACRHCEQFTGDRCRLIGCASADRVWLWASRFAACPMGLWAGSHYARA